MERKPKNENQAQNKDNPVLSVSSAVAASLLKKHLERGGKTEVPSLGVVIEIKRGDTINETTDEE